MNKLEMKMLGDIRQSRNHVQAVMIVMVVGITSLSYSLNLTFEDIDYPNPPIGVLIDEPEQRVHRRYDDPSFMTVSPLSKLLLQEQGRIAYRIIMKLNHTAHASHCDPSSPTTTTIKLNMSKFDLHAEQAQRMSNFLSMFINDLPITATTAGKINFPDGVLFDLCRCVLLSNDDAMVGFGMLFENETLDPTRQIMPYAFRSNDSTVVSFDWVDMHQLSLSTSMLYEEIKQKVKFLRSVGTREAVIYNTSTDKNFVSFSTPFMTLEDGVWSKPYFDCGGTNKWVISYVSAAVFQHKTSSAVLKAATYSTIALEKVDIDQCEKLGVGEDKDVRGFQYTHNCHQTTFCQHLPGHGFRLGHYRCWCRKGFFYPDYSVYSDKTFFPGIAFDSLDTLDPVSNRRFRCLKCPSECPYCMESNDICAYLYLKPIRVLFVSICFVDILLCCAFSVITILQKDHFIMSLDNPHLIVLMNTGGILIIISSVVDFQPDKTSSKCMVMAWFVHIGFTLMYSAILVRCCRIVNIMTGSTSCPTVFIMGPVMIFTLIYMIVWSLFTSPRTCREKTWEGSLYTFCRIDFWNVILISAELLMVLVTIYMCLKASKIKVPILSSEATYSVYSLYNVLMMAALIGLVSFVWGNTQGPDVLYVLNVLTCQMVVILTLSFNMLPKIRKMLKYNRDPDNPVWKHETDPGPSLISKSMAKSELRTGASAGTVTTMSTTVIRKNVVDASCQVDLVHLQS